MESQKQNHETSETSLPSEDAVRQRLAAIETELSKAFYSLVEKRKAAWGLSTPARGTVLKLALEITPPEGVETGRTPGLHSQLKDAAERLASSLGTFPPGHVYCHWCRSFECSHSRPPEPRCVFGGYTATGQPRWPDYATVLLERKDPRIESLFTDPPQPVTLVQTGRELGRSQLTTYGRRSAIYRILGQVLLGYLPLGRNGKNDRSLVAVSLQAVAVDNGTPSVALNVLGSLPDGTLAYEMLEEVSEARLGDALQSARQRLSDISLIRARGRRKRIEKGKRLLQALNQLGRNLERIFRQRRRRTRHSRDRHLDRERPAASALGDALRAKREDIYRDVEQNTWVVIGPRNRVHVFNDSALHITSVVYPGDTIRHRTTRGKWRNVGVERVDAFIETLRRRTEAES